MNKTTQGFIIFSRDYDKTIHKFPNDFNLLAVIAQRAKRTESYDNANLEIGEALIGDFDNYGMTEQEYRTSKKRLIDRGYITIKATPKGTIARLVNSSIFDINPDKSTDKVTDSQRSNTERVTTNNNGNNDNNEKETVGLDYLKNVPTKDIEELSKSINLSESSVRLVADNLYKQYASNGRQISSPRNLLEKACVIHKQKNPRQSESKPWYMDAVNPKYFSKEAEQLRNEDFEKKRKQMSESI